MRSTRLVTAAAVVALAATAVSAAPASASSGATGTKSLAAVLTADGDRFDRNWYDYDIVTEAVLAVLEAKPGSAVGVDAVEQVLLYHVVPGATIAKRDAVKANGAVLTTAQGGTVTVKVRNTWLPLIQLKDADPDDYDAVVNPRAFDINKGNQQIAHGTLLVLRPLDL